MRSRPTLTLAALLAVAMAGCGNGSLSATASVASSAASTDTPEPTVVPSAVSSVTAPVVSSAASTQTPEPSGRATATITVEAGVQADGPGESVSHALANAAIGSQLVNGIMLKEVGGSVWLCEALTTSSPPDCAEPRLLVKGLAQEDQTFANGAGLREAEGVRWVEHAQAFGVVRP